MPMNERAALDDGSVPSGAVSPRRSRTLRGPPGAVARVRALGAARPERRRPRTVRGRGSEAARDVLGRRVVSGASPRRGQPLRGAPARVPLPSRTRRFGDRPRLELLHEITEGLSYPEDVAVSPDGNLLAVTHSMSDDLGVSLFPIDATVACPGPGRGDASPGDARVGVSRRELLPRFGHLAFTEIGAPGYVEVVRVATTTRERTCLLENRHAPLKPKSVAFSRDGRFAVIAMALNASPAAGRRGRGRIVSVHRFDAASGVIGEALAEMHGAATALVNMDICTFLPSISGTPYRILVADQGADMVTLFAFDPEATDAGLHRRLRGRPVLSPWRGRLRRRPFRRGDHLWRRQRIHRSGGPSVCSASGRADGVTHVRRCPRVFHASMMWR